MVSLNHSRPKFPLGRVCATPGALAVIKQSGQTAWEFLQRHAVGDCSDVRTDDAQANEDRLTDGARLLSCYQTHNGTTIWIITNANRSTTMLLLPEEY